MCKIHQSKIQKLLLMLLLLFLQHCCWNSHALLTIEIISLSPYLFTQKNNTRPQLKRSISKHKCNNIQCINNIQCNKTLYCQRHLQCNQVLYPNEKDCRKSKSCEGVNPVWELQLKFSLGQLALYCTDEAAARGIYSARGDFSRRASAHAHTEQSSTTRAGWFPRNHAVMR